MVATVAVSGVTGFVLGATTLRWHLIAGTAMAALLLWRGVWGFLGGQYARFAGFVYSPRAVFAHLRGRGDHYFGHNPLGALMVFALLVVLVAIASTGTVSLGGMLKQGPLRAFLSYATGRQALRLHNLLSLGLLGMVAAHLAGVAFESWREGDNLVRAMVTGRKRAAPQPLPRVRARPLSATVLTMGLGLLGTGSVAALAALPGRGVPPAALDPVYVVQCGSCHLAYPPSLSSAATWNAVLDRMDAHFGEDTGLSPDIIAQLRPYLSGNAAGHWDTLPSWRLRMPATDGSLRITDTPGWRRIHRDIPAARFATAPVYRRSACESCHADAATGRFAPQQIAVPDK
jgi:cytochrome b